LLWQYQDQGEHGDFPVGGSDPPTTPSPQAEETAMTKVLLLLHKRENLSWEEFGRYWREVHRPLAMRLPGLRQYVENHGPEAGAMPYGIAVLYFDNPASFQAALCSPQGEAVLADLANFVDIERTGMTVVSEALTWSVSAAD
jgi:uncharacterized protein (TIGR02118 family)